MRQAHPLSLATLALLMASVSTPALAQSPEPARPAAPSPANDGSVFSPAAPTLPLVHQQLAASGTIVAQPGDWRAANTAVAEFPRGHGDVLKWEKAQSTAAGNAPSAPPHQHGGQP